MTVIRPSHVEAGMKSLQILEVDLATGNEISYSVDTGTTVFLGSEFFAREFATDGFSVTLNSRNGTVYANLVGETGSLFYPANINYDFTIAYNPSTSSAMVLGGHDGFPSITVRVNSAVIYDFQQTPGIFGSTGLFGNDDTKVLTRPTKVFPPKL